jgi:hypothetical protein
MNPEQILVTISSQLPALVVCGAGIVLAFLKLHQQPKAALFVLAGLGLYVLLGISQTLLQAPLHKMLVQNYGQDAQTRVLYLGIVGFAFSVARAISMGLLAYAAFVDRPIVAMMVPVPEQLGR